jgi:AcrR family transcriptional regulator
MPRPSPALTPKKQPAQSRASETYEHILEVTAQTLAEVGFERLSTNLVCQRAGLTPPALYRYFPNKYALLHELGQRLMQRQNALIGQWLVPAVFAGKPTPLRQAIAGLLLDTWRITSETTGGVWIIRALRAVPMLQDIRLASHRKVVAQIARQLHAAFPKADPAELALFSRIANETVYAAVEMLFDDPALDPEAVAAMVAEVLAGHARRLRAE